MTSRTTLLTAAVLVGACQPALDDDPTRVTGARIIAVRSDPPEAKPGEPITLHALYTDGSSTAVAPLAFDFCTARPALAEPTAIAAACLEGGAGRSRIGIGSEARALVPNEACRLFGPERPLGKPGEPAGRPADPDGTGGFYQPGIVSLPGAGEAIFDVRVRCNPSGATQSVVADLERRYRANENPTIEELAIVRGGAASPVADDAEIAVAPGELLELRVTWPACTGADRCGGAERYVAYDPGARLVVARREAIRVSWLATTGGFQSARSGRAEDDEGRDVSTTWQAPAATSVTTIWSVLRDSRGGTSWRSFSARVR